MWAAARRSSGFRNTEKRYQWSWRNLIYTYSQISFVIKFFCILQMCCFKVFTHSHSLQCTKYCLILPPNWFWINEPCTTSHNKIMSQYSYCLKFDQSFQTSMSSQNNEPRSGNKFYKLPWSLPASSWISCHQLCDQTTASVCRSQAGLISGSGRGRTGDWRRSPALLLSQLSVMDSPRWPALASLTLAVTGLRRHPGLMPGQCRRCFVSTV